MTDTLSTTTLESRLGELEGLWEKARSQRPSVSGVSDRKPRAATPPSSAARTKLRKELSRQRPSSPSRLSTSCTAAAPSSKCVTALRENVRSARSASESPAAASKPTPPRHASLAKTSSHTRVTSSGVGGSRAPHTKRMVPAGTASRPSAPSPLGTGRSSSPQPVQPAATTTSVARPVSNRRSKPASRSRSPSRLECRPTPQRNTPTDTSDRPRVAAAAALPTRTPANPAVLPALRPAPAQLEMTLPVLSPTRKAEKFCRFCGKVGRENANFCSKCGEQL